MIGLDYIIVGVVMLSVLFGVWRGFVREALSLLIWVAAFWFAYAWTMTLETYLSGLITEQSLRKIITFMLLFVSVHLFGFIVSILLSTLIKSTGLRGVDRVAGAGFGLVRGVVVIAVLILLVGMTPVQEENMWQQSYMVSVFEDVLDWVQLYYPLDDIGSALVVQSNSLS